MNMCILMNLTTIYMVKFVTLIYKKNHLKFNLKYENSNEINGFQGLN